MENTYKTLKTNILKKCTVLLFLSCFSFTGCEGFLETDLPNSQLITVTVFDNRTTAEAALTDIYSKMRDSGLMTGKTTGISNQLGNYTDELVFYGNSTTSTFAFYNNNLLGSNAQVAEIWNSSFKQIYAANALLEAVQESGNLTIADRAQLEGEALFIRALLHFYLSNIFGDIPYCDSSDYLKNSRISRFSPEIISEKITNDLLAALELLPYSDISKERVRPNKFAAHALLSRIYLYNKKWSQAAEHADVVIKNSSVYYLTPNSETVFLKQSSATIWQFMPSINGKNTDEGTTFYFAKAPPPQSALNPELVNEFTPGDLRKKHWILSLSGGGVTYYRANKYKQFSNTSSSLEYSIVFRLAEQHLIRAEANANLGYLDSALEDLNRIRLNAGLQISNAASKDEILSAIIHERKLELFTEFGHRFFDLKRSGSISQVLGEKKIGWSKNDVIWPIPETELLLNPNLLPQNEGY